MIPHMCLCLQGEGARHPVLAGKRGRGVQGGGGPRQGGWKGGPPGGGEAHAHMSHGHRVPPSSNVGAGAAFMPCPTPSCAGLWGELRRLGRVSEAHPGAVGSCVPSGHAQHPPRPPPRFRGPGPVRPSRACRRAGRRSQGVGAYRALCGRGVRHRQGSGAPFFGLGGGKKKRGGFTMRGRTCNALHAWLGMDFTRRWMGGPCQPRTNLTGPACSASASAGPILAQAAVPASPLDTPESLAARVLVEVRAGAAPGRRTGGTSAGWHARMTCGPCPSSTSRGAAPLSNPQRQCPGPPPNTPPPRHISQEHKLYPKCVAALCDGRISWTGNGMPVLWTGQ